MTDKQLAAFLTLFSKRLEDATRAVDTKLLDTPAYDDTLLDGIWHIIAELDDMATLLQAKA